MNYTTITYTEYQIWYIDKRGNEQYTCKSYKIKQAAQNYINRHTPPSWADHYVIKPIKVIHQKLFSL